MLLSFALACVDVDGLDTAPSVIDRPVQDSGSTDTGSTDTDSGAPQHPPDLSDLYVGLRFDVERTLVDGALTEDVHAEAYFLIPNDPPCPSGEPGCPRARTVSAGPQVWFIGPENLVTLDRVVDGDTGYVTYVGRDLTLADYHFGTVYDLEAPGDPEWAPAFYVVGVQPTVPADYQVLTPAFSEPLTVQRDQDLRYSWTPAQTYPDAVFGVSVADGTGAFVGDLPWDDGEDELPTAELITLAAGSGVFSAFSYVEGESFGLPFSSIQSCQSDSTVSFQAPLMLQ